MQLQPVHNYILIRLYIPAEASSKIQLPGTSPRSAEFGDEHRTKIEVLAVGKEVTCCSVGDFVLLRPNPNLLPTKREPQEALVNAEAVLAVVTDDSRPLTL